MWAFRETHHQQPPPKRAEQREFCVRRCRSRKKNLLDQEGERIACGGGAEIRNPTKKAFGRADGVAADQLGAAKSDEHLYSK